MPQFQRILVPTDFSTLSTHAAAYARELARIHGAEVHVVHVVVPPAMAGTVTIAPGAEPMPAQPPIDTLLEGARNGVARVVREEFPGLSARADVLVGVAYSQICQYARDHACDLIVMGSHARGVVYRIFLGSVSKAVLEHAPCPLLMVPVGAIDSHPGNGTDAPDAPRADA